MTPTLPQTVSQKPVAEGRPVSNGHDPASLGQTSLWLQPALKGFALVCGALVLAAIGALSARIVPNSAETASVNEAALLDLPSGEWLAGGAENQTAPSSAATAQPGAVVAAQSGSAQVGEPGLAPTGARHRRGAGDIPAGPSAGITADGKVILNLASAEDLRRLPGVGPRRATQIVELRERLRRFRKLTDLLRVKGIGPKGLRRMLPLLVLDAPPQPATAPSAAPTAASGSATPSPSPPSTAAGPNLSVTTTRR